MESKSDQLQGFFEAARDGFGLLTTDELPVTSHTFLVLGLTEEILNRDEIEHLPEWLRPFKTPRGWGLMTILFM